MSFKDHFSGHAGDYAKYRPDYPDELFAFLASLAPARDLAWDAGTGSGQAAHGLAAHFGDRIEAITAASLPHGPRLHPGVEPRAARQGWRGCGFARVFATDASAQQIARAAPHPRVTYAAEPAERTSLADSSVDLVTVAQALHWFDLERFYNEVRRVLRPRGVLAAWCYGLNRIAADIDPVVVHFYDGIVGPYWPPERRLIEERYATLPFPFEELSAPEMAMTTHWNLDEFLGYLATWSAVQRYRKELGEDPLPALRARLLPLWGEAASRRTVTWPVYFRIGRVG
jgi:SAM-dependent methyltransferase